MKITHLNCVDIRTPLSPAIGHCLLLEENGRLVLVDSGIGLYETRAPKDTLGEDLINQMGLVPNEDLTAYRQVERSGLSQKDVTDCICTHLDPDHIGGIKDFDNVTVHVSYEEYLSFKEGNPRYLSNQLNDDPPPRLYLQNDSDWFGLPARKIQLDIKNRIYLVPLFGHTLGHCGVAIETDDGKWLFHVGDAYYLRAELTDPAHPVGMMAEAMAVDNALRLQNMEKIKGLLKEHANDVTVFGYHDPSEFPE